MHKVAPEIYKKVLENNGIDVIVPDENDIEAVKRIIYEELCPGIISEQFRVRSLRE